MPTGKAAIRKTVSGIIAHGIPVKELIFLPLEQFPSQGNPSCLYIDITHSNAYYWSNGQYWSVQPPEMFFSGTTEYWEEHPSIISKKDAIYVYTDFDSKDGVDIPSIKIGDGLAYVNSLPFITVPGFTEEEKEFWNNKVSVKIDPMDDENIIFYTGKE